MLMWCDDNYGYLTRMPDSLEQQRKGGHGVYYHLSYWGRPHDYLWLSTTQPGLVYEEMTAAYNKGVRRLWIANVHDPKVAAYQLSLFLDMAWNKRSVTAENLNQHLENWLKQQFGKECGHKLAPVMQKFYELAAVRRPEFMGWSQVELDHQKYPRGLSPAGDTEFNPLAFGNELERYLGEFLELRQRVEAIEKQIRPELSDAFFAAVKYPIFAASAMATKHLEAQESRHIARKESFHHDDEALTSAALSIKAWRELQQLTKFYNEQMAGGKWNGLMDMAPRNLPVFSAPALPDQLSEEEIREYGKWEDLETVPQTDANVIVHNASEFTTASEGAEVIPMLGHSMKAVTLPKGGKLTYKFNTRKHGMTKIYVGVIPTQSVGKDDIRFAVSIDGGEKKVFSLKEPYRSEQWKLQVLRGQAVRTLEQKLGWGTHTLTIEALDDHIIVDQWMVDFNLKRQFYRFPL